MEQIINTTIMAATILTVIIVSQRSQRTLIREITKSLKAADIVEYTDATEEVSEEIPFNQEELQDLDSMDEKFLIKHLEKEYENIKNKS